MLARCRSDVSAALRKAIAGAELSASEGALLLSVRDPAEVQSVCSVADDMRRASVGDRVGFVVNRNINFTNACVKRCGFCAFSRTGVDTEAYFLDAEQVAERARQAHELGATEVCVQAGLPPPGQLSGESNIADLYLRMASAVKEAVPDVHLHAFSPEEVRYGASQRGSGVGDFIRELRDAGVDSLPGTSAEILDDDGRRAIAGERLTAAEWEESIRAAHGAGLRTTSTMMYGHVETPLHIAEHLLTLRRIQADTGGFTEFVPLSFVSSEAPMARSPDRRPEQLRDGPTGREVVLVHAVSRIMLHGAIDNIQVSWPKEGLRSAQHLLMCGANDLGGTLMNESISTAAGATHGQRLSPKQLVRAIEDAGREPFQRNTLYGEVRSRGELGAAFDDLDRVIGRGDADGVFGSFQRLVRAEEDRFKAHFRPAPRKKRARRQLHTSRHICTKSQPRARPHWQRARRPFSAEAADSRAVTYSPSITMVPTYECFNTCTYCSFREPVGRGRAPMSELAAHRLLDSVPPPPETREALVLSGEVPMHSPKRGAWFERIESLCRVALERGFQPHTNAGPLLPAEMAALKATNVSMGLMLEQLTPALRRKGGVHARAPSKDPALRVEQIAMAGELRIPFTTGVLLGIGEQASDTRRSLEKIAELAQRYGHIQECIVQPLSPGEGARDQSLSQFDLAQLPGVVAAARSVLPAEVAVQVPPNLALARVDRDAMRSIESGDEEAALAGDFSDGFRVLADCFEAGASDIGGISPFDEVNPDWPFPKRRMLAALLARHGYELVVRNAVHRRLEGMVPEDVVARCVGIG